MLLFLSVTVLLKISTVAILTYSNERCHLKPNGLSLITKARWSLKFTFVMRSNDFILCSPLGELALYKLSFGSVVCH